MHLTSNNLLKSEMDKVLRVACEQDIIDEYTQDIMLKYVASASFLPCENTKISIVDTKLFKTSNIMNICSQVIAIRKDLTFTDLDGYCVYDPMLFLYEPDTGKSAGQVLELRTPLDWFDDMIYIGKKESRRPKKDRMLIKYPKPIRKALKAGKMFNFLAVESKKKNRLIPYPKQEKITKEALVDHDDVCYIEKKKGGMRLYYGIW